MIKKLNSVSLSIMLLIAVPFANARENVGKRNPNINLNKVAAGCNPTAAQTDLKYNNIRTRIFVGGDMWWDLVGAPQYEIPKNTGKHSLFAGSIWVGGYDANNNLKVAGQTYRQGGGNDFFAGPLNNSGSFPDVASTSCQKYDRQWNITREQVDAFIETGVATKDIKEWPGNGDVQNGELQFLAPFEDVNANGIYEYGSGDYPRYNLLGEFPPDPNNPGLSICDGYIFGDQTLWWVFNDVGGTKTETGSAPIGLEIRAQAFAFKTNDEINNMTFYKYEIINRSSLSFDSTYFGQWADPDLGDYADDYVGCDVGLGLGYCYNGDEDDGAGTAAGYGIDPPAVGIDFFQGPLADRDLVGDGIDNNGDGTIDNTPEGDGIDNDKDGTIDEAGEQIIMAKFVYYRNDFSVYGNPVVTDDYYQYLTGSWTNGDRITHDGLDGTNQSFPVCNYMFPGATDPDFAGQPSWTEATAGNVAGDRRFLQSAGEFTLKAGAVNFITTGALWARATSGGAQASITLLKVADEKAQALFNSCFKTLDGPDAPDVAIRELNNKLVLSLQNTGNKKVEFYSEIDPGIPPTIEPDTQKRKYNFQGYFIYQFKNASVTTGDLNNPDLCRLLYQIDRKDAIERIVNWAYDENIGGYVPTQHTYSSAERQEANQGLKHTFVITDDEFAANDKKLINHKAYYYTVISYAYNNYLPFLPVLPSSNNTTQQKPFLAGRNNIKTYTGIPHNPSLEAGGQIFNSEVGDGVIITRIEGQGNGGVLLDMTAASREEAIAGPNYTVPNPVYEAGRGPLNIKVYDPAKIEHGHFEMKFTGTTTTSNWKLTEDEGAYDTSDFNLGEINEQVLVTETYDYSSGKPEVASSFDLGLTGDINNVFAEPGQADAVDNGFLDGTMEFANGNAWLTGVPDTEGDTTDEQNWIRSGDGSDATAGDLYVGLDDDQVYEKVIGGTWAPYKLCGKANNRFNVKLEMSSAGENVHSLSAIGTAKAGLGSVDIVITSDKSKWSRCPVVETGYPENLNVGGAKRFYLRKEKSIDKDGRKYGEADANNTEAGLVDTMGMGWFPGYAVNLESGERLNMAYGENSQLAGDNGTDMIWNPTSRMYDGNNPIFGGMHYLYVFGHNANAAIDIPKYDDGFKIDSLLKAATTVPVRNAWIHAMWVNIPLLAEGKTLLSDDVLVRLRVARKYKAMNTNFDASTYLNNTNTLSYGSSYYVVSGTATYNTVNFATGSVLSVPNDNSLPNTFTGTGVLAPTKNGTNPMYTFGTDGMEAVHGVTSVAKDALALINVVPNPYYAYSSYETRQNDSWAKITNLPAKCTVTIYTLNGTLIRKFNRDTDTDLSEGAIIANSQGTEAGSGNYDTSLDWDLNNTAGVPISSGVYLIHINAPGLGERTLKWFGVLRPIDLDSY